MDILQNNMTHAQQIAAKLGFSTIQATAAIELLDDGNTLPFIARYRKEATGGLDEDQLRQLSGMLDSLRALDKRRQTILETIAEQGKLTPELKGKLLAAETLTALEDLYQPYKPKRRTRASDARDKGLQGLADLILAQGQERMSLDQIAAPFLSEDVTTVEEALAGARDIAAEIISERAEVRQRLREKGQKWGTLTCHKIDSAEDDRGVYRIYYDYQARVDRLRPYQVLAINRGEAEKILRVNIVVPERDWREAIMAYYRLDRRSLLAGQLEIAIEDAAKRLLLPAIERDIRRSLSDEAENHAINVFAVNLRNLLLQPPLAGFTVLGIDPGYRTGCKVAVVDPTGKVLDTATIYPHEPQKQWPASLDKLEQLVSWQGVNLIAIGNGTASRETEQLAANLIHGADGSQKAEGGSLQYLITNEAGASVYSASPLARKELPDLDVSIRGAVSIARRVQDPLAELVKIDPRSIGVGLYQHDVNQGRLTQALDGVVESVVNQVGVEVNTASAALLTHVAGVGPKLADNIVSYRDENGPFPNRQALRQVTGLGPKSFEQAAGFLRISDGDNPLDASAIHPESYAIAETVLQRAGLIKDVPPGERESALDPWQDRKELKKLAVELKTGEPTLSDILEQLVRPGRDPRDDLPPPILRSDVISMEDLQPGMLLNGTVRNVVDFGAFVDIGVKHDGLLHRSQWPQNPHFGVGDVIEVVVVNVEPDRGRISLGWPA